MANLIELETKRLRLRQWRLDDRKFFAALNSDQRVMAFFPSLLTHADSDAMADRCQLLFEQRGWGFWAVEIKATLEFIGFTGLHILSAELPFSPCVEIGWRLAFHQWGKGYATEAAREVLNFGFDALGLHETISFTTISNIRSRAVMMRLGMCECGTFEHPRVPESTGLKQHCLYRMSRDSYADTIVYLPSTRHP